MSATVLYMSMSLDGFIADEHDNLDWLLQLILVAMMIAWPHCRRTPIAGCSPCRASDRGHRPRYASVPTAIRTPGASGIITFPA